MKRDYILNNKIEELPESPRGLVLNNEYFAARACVAGEADELAQQLSLVMRTNNALNQSTRDVFLAPSNWKTTEDGIELELVGRLDSRYTLVERWRDESAHSGVAEQTTTYAIQQHLESIFNLNFEVRTLSLSSTEDCMLIDAMAQLYEKSGRGWRMRNNSGYPSIDDLISSGNQTRSVLGTQGEYAASSPYFSINLVTEGATQESFDAAATSDACKALYRATGIMLTPRALFRREDDCFELRLYGCTYRHFSYRSTHWKDELIPATASVIDPIEHYLNMKQCAFKLFQTTAAYPEEIREAELVADELELVGLPEPEDFIVRSLEEIEAEDKRKQLGKRVELEDVPTGEEELDQLICLAEVKRQVREFVSFACVQKHRGGTMPHLHMRFDGNPGTGKTSVARIIGHMLYDEGLLPKRNVFVETSGMQFSPKDIKQARRGVLFIDEAYMLNSYQLADLFKAMEDCHQNFARDGFIVIFAGYPSEMAQMVSKNPGFRDRIGIALEFEDYTADELIAIFKQLVTSENYTLEEGAQVLIEEKLRAVEQCKGRNFSNGRIVRKIFERIQMRQATMFGLDSCIHASVIEDVFADDEFADLVGERGRSEAAHNTSDKLSGDEQLARLMGLEKMKGQITEFLDYAAVQKERGGIIPSLHMCFKGNPGTGKTTLARIVGRMMYDRGLLPRRDRFVETDRSQLVAKYVGWTAHTTKKKINEARHGVLFIDEAYSLDGGSENDFGKEALSTLVKEMEDCRENYERDGFVCIMAGYPDLMDEMISLNPGLRDRFGLTLDFEDYSAEELLAVFELYAADEKYTLAKAARTALAEQFESVVAAKDDDFANARLVRKVFERAKMRQASLHGTNSCFKADVIRSVFEDEDLSRLIGTQASACVF